ncbi:septation protein SepH [Arthrobacter sp.]|uniref:septation protein SepH n=1 Tax=Arthrobacter sp. TaxID=1667 RepID=UPI0026E01F66|nr:septation protein SepH [Arthrobacter sp.]MDO5754174.1 septation protein SepH [Arthrobacter sp.]
MTFWEDDMADLRLVGVHDDGGHLLLSGPDGDIYLLPLDEALRTAVGKTHHRLPNMPQQPGTRMRPREIQALIRAGATAAEVSEQSGLSLEQVRRYEGPVLAEREYIAGQARAVEVAAPTAHNDGYKAAFGESPASLDEMVRHRLAAFGIDPKSLRWDAWRDKAGDWTISANFEPSTERAATSIGEAPPALWRYHAARKALHNANRWAQQLSELEPLDSPISARRLSAVVDKPFDVEADAESSDLETELSVEGATDTDATPAEAVPESDEDSHSHGLLEMLRSRRGVRLGVNEAGDDELAAMLGSSVPGAHPRDEEFYGIKAGESQPEADAPEANPIEEAPAAAVSPRDRLRSIPFLKLAPCLSEHDAQGSNSVGSVAEVSSETREVVVSREPSTSSEPQTHVPEESGASDSDVTTRLERKASTKPKRSSVPSWDEIVFGTKGD